MNALKSKTLGFTIFWLSMVLYSVISYLVIGVELSYTAVIIDTAGYVSSMYLTGQKYLDYKNATYDINKPRHKSKTFWIAIFWCSIVPLCIAAIMKNNDPDIIDSDLPSLGKIIAFAGANTVIYLGGQKAVDTKKTPMKSEPE